MTSVAVSRKFCFRNSGEGYDKTEHVGKLRGGRGAEWKEDYGGGDELRAAGPVTLTSLPYLSWV